jgi:tetraacyldisaccharide 4'-kinase
MVYGAVAHFRARAYRTGLRKQRRLDGWVISVGNLTTGGTGKTPMVAWIAERLVKEGKHTGILTRGYRGKSSEGIGNTSDEVKLLRARLGERVAIGVGADRFAKGRELAIQGIEWFVLDDGFQHLQLARDVDIVLVDATNPFGGGHLLPAGRLREPKSAIRRADVIVITRSAHAPAVEAAVRRESAAPIFYAHMGLDAIRSFTDGKIGGAISASEVGPAFAFCGIGNPGAFLADLRAWGVQVAGHKFFRDHHRYTDRDGERIMPEAKAAGARALICTEKDLYNLRVKDFGGMPLHFCRISLAIDREGEFWDCVLKIAEARRNAAVRGLPLGPAGNGGLGRDA